MPGALYGLEWARNNSLAYTGIYHEKYRKLSVEVAGKMGNYLNYPVSKDCT